MLVFPSCLHFTLFGLLLDISSCGILHLSVNDESRFAQIR
jgi:hypothetical protein